ncbi:MAG TPA: adenylyl-sulfate kinase [Vulgatibacter sp.]|nr:adenylyl-sulfate kinase [Vulgatibacter sp.]
METQQGFTLWLTGMSGAGKSALASYLVRRFPLAGRRVELLDPGEMGDLAPDAPDTGREERDRTVRLLGWMAKLLTRNGVIPVVASISPHREVRDEQRRQIGRFFEVMVECPFEILMERDTEGIYRRALAGESDDVVGVQTPYEPPQQPEAVVDMAKGDVEAAAAEIFDKLASHGYLSRRERDLLVTGSAPSEAPARASRQKGRVAGAAAAAKGKPGSTARTAKAAASKGKAPAKATAKAKSAAKAAPAKAKAATKAATAKLKATARSATSKAKATTKAAPTKAKAAGKPAPAKASAKQRAAARTTKAAPKTKAPARTAKPASKARAAGKPPKAKARTAARKVRAAR